MTSEKRRGTLGYIADLAYGATKYPCGWMRPSVVQGCFDDSYESELQKLFFEVLIEQGFRRTYWQLVFPGQTAGLVRKQKTSVSEPNEHHVRFYEDGVIDCELEYDRFNGHHWTGLREGGIDFLNEFLSQHVRGVSDDIKEEIRSLFGRKPYAEECVRD